MGGSRTVTFLFTDIEGSTRLWDESPDVMRPALARHDALLREAIAQNGGETFKTVGDAFCAAFGDAPAAIAAALAAQTALTGETWPTPRPIRVRMALHTGTAEARDDDYFGPPLNRVARLLATGHGGQTLVSAAAYELVRDVLPEGASLVPLGEHRLKDLARPEAVYGLLHPALPKEFPPLRSLDSDALPNNLPEQTTSFVGREEELREVAARLKTARLLTLAGPGGTGKTRLALQAAAESIDAFPDGVWLVELAPLAEPDLVAPTVLAAVGLREIPGRGALPSLVEGLRGKSLLVLLDNCEHLLNESARLADALLRGCPGVRILATSREALNVAGEAVVRVPALALPRRDAPHTPESLDAYDAVRLFVERAGAALPSFSVTNANAPAVAGLCARLDGIPLALELAAARVKALSVEKILGRLDDRFRFLTGGARTALPRQQTLRALVDWSYDLLTDAERTALDRLAVFAGGWTLAAAETVVGFDPIEEWETLDLLAALVDKSLVHYDPETERYGMLETIRQYAAERLAARPEEADTAAVRQAQAALAPYEALGPIWQNRADASTFEGLEEDLDNLRAACEHLLRTDGDAAGNLMCFAAPVWYARGRSAEGLALFERGLAAWPRFGGKDWTVNMVLAGMMAQWVDNYPRATEHFERALAERRREGSPKWIVNGLYNLAGLHMDAGDPAHAKVLLLEARAIADDSPGSLGLSGIEASLGVALALLGDHEAAPLLLLPAEGRSREAGDLLRTVVFGFHLGWLSLQKGEAEKAQSWLTGILEPALRSGHEQALDFCYLGLVALFDAQGRDEAAARIAGLHDRIHREAGTLIAPVFRAEHTARVAKVRVRLGDAAFDAAYEKGERMDAEAARAYAFDALKHES